MALLTYVGFDYQAEALNQGNLRHMSLGLTEPAEFLAGGDETVTALWLTLGPSIQLMTLSPMQLSRFSAAMCASKS